MKISKKILKRMLIICCIIVVIVTDFWINPYIRSFFPHSYKANSSTLEVKAGYYELTLDGIDSLYVKDGCIVAAGYDVNFYNLKRQPPISRELPEEYANLSIPDTSWHLKDTISYFKAFTEKAIYSTVTGDTILISFPYRHESTRIAAFKGEGDSLLIVLGSGDFKRGAKAHLGYVFCHRRHE